MSNENEQRYDPFEAWRDLRDASLDAWSKAMIDAVKSDNYAKSTGTMLDTYLTASLPFRTMLEKVMLQTLEQLSMPSRDDVLSLAERLINIEMKLDDLDAKIDRIEVKMREGFERPRETFEQRPRETRRTAQQEPKERQ